MDKRIGDKFLNSGPGFGGSCFQKDILNLVYLCNFYNLKEVAEYWEKVIQINSWQQKRISKIIVEKLFGTLTNKKIGILGFSFKANTNDTRESPAIKICLDLIEEGANISIYDPKVSSNQISNDLDSIMTNKSKDKFGSWQIGLSVSQVSQNADAIVVITEWDEFRNINWKSIAIEMRKPCWVFDCRNIVDKKEAKSNGINVWEIGC